MSPLFFVQNNLVERLTVPVASFARARGIALEDRSSTSDFDPSNCGIKWGDYGPVLPYGSVQMLRKFKTTPVAKFVLLDILPALKDGDSHCWKAMPGLAKA